MYKMFRAKWKKEGKKRSKASIEMEMESTIHFKFSAAKNVQNTQTTQSEREKNWWFSFAVDHIPNEDIYLYRSQIVTIQYPNMYIFTLTDSSEMRREELFVVVVAVARYRCSVRVWMDVWVRMKWYTLYQWDVKERKFSLTL